MAGGAAAAVLASGSKADPADADADHDGFSVRQGDCNDADATVRPGGDVQLTVDFAFDGTTACGARNPRPQVYRLANQSCDTVTVQGLQVTLTLGGTCTGGESYALSLEAASVGPGATAIVRHGAAAGTVAPLCCQSYPCTPGTCTVSLQYALATSAGTKTVGETYSIADPSGRDCALCGSVGTDETLLPVSGGGDGTGCPVPLRPY